MYSQKWEGLSIWPAAKPRMSAYGNIQLKNISSQQAQQQCRTQVTEVYFQPWMSPRQEEQARSAYRRWTKFRQRGRSAPKDLLPSGFARVSVLQVHMEQEEQSWSPLVPLHEVSAPPCLFCSYWHWFAAFPGIYAINTYGSFQNSLAGLHCKQCCSLMFPASILGALQNLQQAPFSGILSPSNLSTLSSWRAEELWFQTPLLYGTGKSREVVARETEHLANVYWTSHNKPMSSGGSSLWQPNSRNQDIHT